MSCSRLRWFATLLWILAGTPGTAAPLRVCVDQKPQPPFIDASGGGISGNLIRHAAAAQGLALTFHAAPTTRCREEMRAGVMDAFPTTPYTPAVAGFMAYPMVHGKPDGSKAIVVARAFAYRKIGDPVDWDGKQFHHLHSPVLVPYGSVLLTDRLRDAGIVVDEKGKTLEQVFLKLMAGRGQIALGAEYIGMALLSDPRFIHKLEVLPIVYSEEPYFFSVTQSYYGRNKEQVDALWEAIGRERATPAYQATLLEALSKVKASGGQTRR